MPLYAKVLRTAVHLRNRKVYTIAKSDIARTSAIAQSEAGVTWAFLSYYCCDCLSGSFGHVLVQ